jgi:hypothetical protein
MPMLNKLCLSWVVVGGEGSWLLLLLLYNRTITYANPQIYQYLSEIGSGIIRVGIRNSQFAKPSIVCFGPVAPVPLSTDSYSYSAPSFVPPSVTVTLLPLLPSPAVYLLHSQIPNPNPNPPTLNLNCQLSFK